MAKEKKAKKPIYITPPGIGRYPSINKPDFGTDEYPIEGGAFKTDLIFSDEVAQEIIDRIKELMPEAKALAKEAEKAAKSKGKKAKNTDSENVPYYKELDDQGEETENTIFKFKKKYSGKKKDGTEWTAKLPVFDAKGKPISPVPRIGGGSTLRASYTLTPYYTPAVGYGVSLRLEAVKLLDLVEFGAGGSAKSYGFADEEEGFVADDDDEDDVDTKEDTESEEDQEEDGDDF